MNGNPMTPNSTPDPNRATEVKAGIAKTAKELDLNKKPDNPFRALPFVARAIRLGWDATFSPTGFHRWELVTWDSCYKEKSEKTVVLAEDHPLFKALVAADPNILTLNREGYRDLLPRYKLTLKATSSKTYSVASYSALDMSDAEKQRLISRPKWDYVEALWRRLGFSKSKYHDITLQSGHTFEDTVAKLRKQARITALNPLWQMDYWFDFDLNDYDAEQKRFLADWFPRDEKDVEGKTVTISENAETDVLNQIVADDIDGEPDDDERRDELVDSLVTLGDTESAAPVDKRTRELWGAEKDLAKNKNLGSATLAASVYQHWKREYTKVAKPVNEGMAVRVYTDILKCTIEESLVKNGLSETIDKLQSALDDFAAKFIESNPSSKPPAQAAETKASVPEHAEPQPNAVAGKSEPQSTQPSNIIPFPESPFTVYPASDGEIVYRGFRWKMSIRYGGSWKMAFEKADELLALQEKGIVHLLCVADAPVSAAPTNITQFAPPAPQPASAPAPAPTPANDGGDFKVVEIKKVMDEGKVSYWLFDHAGAEKPFLKTQMPEPFQHLIDINAMVAGTRYGVNWNAKWKPSKNVGKNGQPFRNLASVTSAA